LRRTIKKTVCPGDTIVLDISRAPTIFYIMEV